MVETKGFTWQEVAAHNCEETGVWIAVDDTVYDVTKFLAHHPGGKEYILLAAGRDATDLFISYHPFTSKPRKVLESYAIGKLTTRQYPRFKPDTGFYKTLCTRVNDYFVKNNIDHKAPFASLWRMTMMLAIYCISYIGLFTSLLDSSLLPSVDSSMYSVMWWVQRFFFAVILGWSQMMFLLHIMHDCSHSAVGHSETWWKVCGRFFSETFVGTSMVSWHNQHVVGHHIYTSVYSIDPDVPVNPDGDIRLILPQQRNTSMYKYQHIYLAILYCFLSFKSRFQDLTIHLSRKNGPIDVNPVTTTQWIRLFFSKFIHVVLRIVIPLYLVTPAQCFILYLISELVGGGYLAFNFQVSHVSDAAEVPVAKAIPASQSFPVNQHIHTKDGNEGHVYPFNIDESKFTAADRAKSDLDCRQLKGVTEATPEELIWDLEWARLQVHTSVDYAHDSAFCTFMCGALNYQTVHHLFPTVSQYLYPYIADIVKQTCKEYGVRYNYIDTFSDAIAGHFNYLKKMGERGIHVEAPKLE